MFGKTTKMFFALMFAVVLVIGFSQLALADYHDPPGWDENPYFTHQSWEFNSLDIDPETPGWQLPPCSEEGNELAISPGVPGRGDPPDLPLEPDKVIDEEPEGFINSYGTPYLIYALPTDAPFGDWAWVSRGGPWTRCGYYGGMGDTALVFEIPSSEMADMQKQMWVQWTYYLSQPEGDDWGIEVGRGYELYPDASNPLERVEITDTEGIYVEVTREDYVGGGGSGTWYRSTADIRFNDHPGTVYVKVYAFTSGAASLIDEVDIDTQSVTMPTIGYKPLKIRFTGTEGGPNPEDQSLEIWSFQEGETLNWQVEDDATWLSLSPESGTSTGPDDKDIVTVSVDITGMVAGNYEATITITDTNDPGQTQTVPVFLTVLPETPPEISFSPSQLNFIATQGGENPDPKTLDIWNSGAYILNWSADDDAYWLFLDPESGTSTGEEDKNTVEVSVDIAGMGSGEHEASITIKDPIADNSPQEVPVILTLREDWSGNEYYTHQVWDFDALNWEQLHCPPQEGDPDPESPGVPGEGDPPDPPLAPDARGDEWINDYGDPLLIYALSPDGWSWYSMGGPWTRCGYYGGMGDTALVFAIPQPEELPEAKCLGRMEKELRVEWTFFASNPIQGQGCAIDVGRAYEEDPEQEDPVDRVIITDTEGIKVKVSRVDDIGGGGSTGIWYRASANIRFSDETDMLYIKLYALTDGAATLIDDVFVESRIERSGLCFISTVTYGSNLEPSFILVLLVLAAGVISSGYRWRRE
ncbi:MAG: BACON domain-containing protein [Deltaproteobacteria bacterium]|nr:BACON domain-containing protein [Deltaproteobacteria bacterium]